MTVSCFPSAYTKQDIERIGLHKAQIKNKGEKKKTKTKTKEKLRKIICGKLRKL